MATEQNTAKDVSLARDRIARFLMIGLGIASLIVFANTARQFNLFGPERVNVEAWRMFGFSVFAGLYFMLAFFPRRMPGLWELVFYHKVGVAIFLGFVGVAAQGVTAHDTTSNIVVGDMMLAGTTVVAYVMAKGWRAWARTV